MQEQRHGAHAGADEPEQRHDRARAHPARGRRARGRRRRRRLEDGARGRRGRRAGEGGRELAPEGLVAEREQARERRPRRARPQGLEAAAHPRGHRPERAAEDLRHLLEGQPLDDVQGHRLAVGRAQGGEVRPEVLGVDALGGARRRVVRRSLGARRRRLVAGAPRPRARQVEGRVAHDPEEPRGERPPRRVEAPGGAQDVDERLLRRVLGGGRVAGELVRQPVGARPPPLEEQGHGGLVAPGQARDEVLVGERGGHQAPGERYTARGRPHPEA
ncbi:MAG: hypothetical protein M9894_25100 [Planctomycetes bacterium]|nr:hypothetical protein [Planctomycetota bacterium]